MPRLVLLAAVLCLCAGCTSSTTRHLMTGDFEAVLEESGGRDVDYTALGTHQVWALCQAYAKTRMFAEFDRCAQTLDARVEDADGVLLYLIDGLQGNRFHAVGATAAGMITRLKTEAALARGDDAAAAAGADRLVEITSRYDYPFDRRRLGGDYDAWPAAGTGREAAYSRILRRKHLVEGLGVRGLVAARAGDAETARAFAARIDAVDSQGSNATQWRLPDAKALWNARIHTTLGDYERAYEAMTTVDRSRLYRVLKSLDDALTVLNPVMLATFVDATGGFDLDAWNFTADFETRFMLHRAELETGRLEAARAGYDTILAEDRVEGYGTVYWQALHGRGRIALLEGDRATARRYFERAADVIEAQRRSLDTEAGRVGFVGDKQALYADLVGLLVEDGDAEAAFEYMERAKARALVDMLATLELAPVAAPGVAAPLERLAELERESLRLARAADAEARARSRSLAEERAALLAEVPELASLVSVQAPTLAEVRGRLGPDEALLEYFGHGDLLHAVVVDRDRAHVATLDGRDLGADVAELRLWVQDFASDPEDYEPLLEEMYDRIVRPLGPVLSARRLTIVPHGPLHYVPFAALGDGETQLADRHELRLLPAAAVTRFVDDGGTAQRRLLAFGNPDRGDPSLDLPGAERETRLIDREWDDSRILLRKLASEANFKRFAPTFDYLHLASHGEFDGRVPLASRMLLAPGDGEDGDLTAAELYGLRLSADLVTLSACETGLGDVTGGDDVIGLTRGFLFAGADSVVTSLWPVSDAETAFLMERFYAALAGQSKGAALREAVLATRARHPHPAFWSAFNLTGAR
ncbi:MAG: CHAT domain-containing protein [Pseudomonadales bacterium]|jgi:CHAT domain-containing protein|nr:CHAT domain-containing protein [Pseudomonadales bacterium]